MVADAPSHISFNIWNSTPVALEAKNLSVVLSSPSNDPNQLWSLFPDVYGPWIINRGTGAYLGVENGVALVKIETPYEWKIQKGGSSVRIESAVSPNQFLHASPQGIKLSANRDAGTLLTFPSFANPTLSIGSEDYLHSPEHTCVTNHVYNTVNALNGLVRILEHPDKASSTDTMTKLFTLEHYKLFKTRGTEATQNLDFAREIVKAWFTAIGNKMISEVKQKGNLEAAATNEKPIRQSAEASLTKLRKTHIKTEADLRAQQDKFDTADKAYTAAKSQYDTSVVEEQKAIKDHNMDSSYAVWGGGGTVPAPSMAKDRRVEATKNQRVGDEAKMNSRKTEREHEETLLTPLKTQSTLESTKITQLEADVAKAKNIIDGNTTKATQLQAHHDILNTLYGSLNNCRTHLADTLEYNLAGNASLTMVRTKLKNLVDVLQRGDDFKEPLQILNRAKLDRLLANIPAIRSHAST